MLNYVKRIPLVDSVLQHIGDTHLMHRPPRLLLAAAASDPGALVEGDHP